MYGIAEIVPISIIFDTDVIVTGTPKLTLETGTTDDSVNYTSGSESDTLLFDLDRNPIILIK